MAEENQIKGLGEKLLGILAGMAKDPKYQAQPDQPQQPETPQPSEQPQSPKPNALAAAGGTASVPPSPVAAYTGGDVKPKAPSAASYTLPPPSEKQDSVEVTEFDGDVETTEGYTGAVDFDASEASPQEAEKMIEGSEIEEAFEIKYKQGIAGLNKGLKDLLDQASRVNYNPQNLKDIIEKTEKIYGQIVKGYHEFEDGDIDVENYSEKLRKRSNELKVSINKLTNIDIKYLEELKDQYQRFINTKQGDEEGNKKNRDLVQNYIGKVMSLGNIIDVLKNYTLIHSWTAKALENLIDIDGETRKKIEEKRVDEELVNNDLKQNYLFLKNKKYPKVFYKRGLEREVSRELMQSEGSFTNEIIVEAIEKVSQDLGFKTDSDVNIFRLVTKAETFDNKARVQELDAKWEAENHQRKMEELELARRLEELTKIVETTEEDGTKEDKLKKINSLSGSLKQAEGHLVDKINEVEAENKNLRELLEKREFRIESVAEIAWKAEKAEKDVREKAEEDIEKANRWGWLKSLVAAASIGLAALGVYEYKIIPGRVQGLRNDVTQITSERDSAKKLAEDAVKERDESVAAKTAAEGKVNGLEEQIEMLSQGKGDIIAAKQKFDESLVRLQGEIERLETDKKRIEDELAKAEENRADPALVAGLKEQLAKANEKASDAVKGREEAVAAKKSYENQFVDLRRKYEESERRKNELKNDFLKTDGQEHINNVIKIMNERDEYKSQLDKAKTSGDPVRVAELEGKLTEANEKVKKGEEAIAAKNELQTKYNNAEIEMTGWKNKYESAEQSVKRLQEQLDKLVKGSGAESVISGLRDQLEQATTEKDNLRSKYVRLERGLADAKKGLEKSPKRTIKTTIRTSGINVHNIDPKRLELMEKLFGK